MGFWDRFEGVAFLKITTAYPAGALQRIQKAEIAVHNIRMLDPFTIQLAAKHRDVSSIVDICTKRGDRVDVEGWEGYIFRILSFLKRPVFLLCAVCWLILALWLPTRILFVTVKGADTLSEAYILECAAEYGISMGASGRTVRSEGVKNALLSAIPNLRWAGVNTSGCVATIHVSEEAPSSTNSPNLSITDIVSNQDGVITSVTTHNGTALCVPGQAVKQGQALISAYRDNGQNLEFTGASGEIYGKTKRSVEALTPLQVYKRTEILSQDENFYVVVGKNPIKFQKDSGILDTTCVKMYNVKDCVLPGGFELPIYLVTERIIEYAVEPATLTADDCLWLLEQTEEYIDSHMIDGNIISANTTFGVDDSKFVTNGQFDCIELLTNADYKGITESNGKVS